MGENINLSFRTDEFRQTRVVVHQALEEQPRIVPAPFEFVANWADLLKVVARV